jgi:hypothetical protein
MGLRFHHFTLVMLANFDLPLSLDMPRHLLYEKNITRVIKKYYRGKLKEKT